MVNKKCIDNFKEYKNGNKDKRFENNFLEDNRRDDMFTMCVDCLSKWIN